MSSTRLLVSTKDDIRRHLNNCSWNLDLFPYTHKEMQRIQEECLPPEAVAALHTIDRIKPPNSPIIERTSGLQINLEDSPEGFKLFSIGGGYFSRDQHFYTWTRGHNVVTVPKMHPDHAQFREWAQKMVVYKIQRRAFQMVADGIYFNCNTSGQILRVWPEILRFLPPNLVRLLQDAKKSSPVPDGITTSMLFWIPMCTHWMTTSEILKGVSQDADKEYAVSVDYNYLDAQMKLIEAGIDTLGVLE